MYYFITCIHDKIFSNILRSAERENYKSGVAVAPAPLCPPAPPPALEITIRINCFDNKAGCAGSAPAIKKEIIISKNFVLKIKFSQNFIIEVFKNQLKLNKVLNEDLSKFNEFGTSSLNVEEIIISIKK